MKKIIVLTGFFLVFGYSAVSQGEWTYDNLTTFKFMMGSARLGSSAYFAGGITPGGLIDEVEIYNTRTKEWSYDNLSVARNIAAGVSAGSKVFFAGGADDLQGTYSTVDIYDTASGQWIVNNLSVPRINVSAVSMGSKVLFAGGGDLALNTEYDVVDIYDIETEAWTTTYLSEPRVAMGSAVIGDQAFFAGGWLFSNKTATDKVDIYNFSTGTWTTAGLSEPRFFIGTVVIGDKILFAGGMGSNGLPSSRVDIYNSSTDAWSVADLSVARAFWEHENAASVCGKAYFVGGFILDTGTYQFIGNSDVIDIYDAATGVWSVEQLPEEIFGHSTIAVDNHLLIAGGARIIGEFFGLSDALRIFTCTTVATRELDFETNMRVYPNPTSGSLFLAFDDNVQQAKVCITDIAGKLIFETSSLNAMVIEINTSGFTEGVYVVQVQTTVGVQSQKIVVAR